MNLTALEYLILAVAAWRLAHLLVHEDAPFRLMARLRERTTFGGVLTCVNCACMWTAALMLALWYTPSLRLPVVIVAISGAALMLATYTGVRRP